MIHEKSCGAVIFFEKDSHPLFLIEKMNVGHCSLCKGHVEHGETEHDTAAREILEETSLSVTFIDGFRQVIEYSPRPGCMKEVVFYLAKSDSLDTSAQECEVAEIYWLPFEEAYTTLTHDSDRGVLSAADEFIKNM